jgi:hypothetical protein
MGGGLLQKNHDSTRGYKLDHSDLGIWKKLDKKRALLCKDRDYRRNMTLESTIAVLFVYLRMTRCTMSCPWTHVADR